MQNSSIPYQIRAALLQLEPSLDVDWNERLTAIFNDVDMALREEIDSQILKPKEIVWNRVSGTFDHKAPSTLAILKHSLTHERMRGIAKTLSESLEDLKTLYDCMQIADYLENAIEQIDQIQVEENFVLQREKLLIRRTFLLNVAKVIRRMQITPPVGIRKLTEAQIKCFIIEVFIKKQLLGYWFKPLLKRNSPLMKLPIFRYYLSKQQKIRHFELVKTSELIFVTAPVMQVEQNPYSLRRFLAEEKGALPDQVFLNVIVLDITQAEENDYIDSFKKQVECMVTIQSQINVDVMDLVIQLEDVCENTLIPLLIEPIQFVAKNADVVAQMHLKKFENALTGEFFKPVHEAVKSHLSHIEEFDYLYLNMHRLYSELLAYYREFKEQPSLVFNPHVQQFEYKLVGFLKLLEKRRQDNFVPLNQTEWEVMHQRSLKPVHDIRFALTESLLDFRELTIYTNKLKRQSAEKTSFLKRMAKGNQAERDLSEALKAGQQLKHKMFMSILQAPRQNPKCSVFLEFESLHNFSEHERHYAFPCGDNGLTRLPILLRLPDNYADFDVENFNASINFDLNFSVASKAEKMSYELNYST